MSSPMIYEKEMWQQEGRLRLKSSIPYSFGYKKGSDIIEIRVY